MGRTIAIATLVAGTLDIVFAMILALLNGREIGNMLRFVGSGPFPPATQMGLGGAIIGLATHFSLIAIMAAVFVVAARQWPQLVRQWPRWGVLYGVATYVVMNWIVVPLRFDAPWPTRPMSVATQLFAHIVLVGIPLALVARRQSRHSTI